MSVFSDSVGHPPPPAFPRTETPRRKCTDAYACKIWRSDCPPHARTNAQGRSARTHAHTNRRSVVRPRSHTHTRTHNETIAQHACVRAWSARINKPTQSICLTEHSDQACAYALSSARETMCGCSTQRLGCAHTHAHKCIANTLTPLAHRDASSACVEHTQTPGKCTGSGLSAHTPLA